MKERNGKASSQLHRTIERCVKGWKRMKFGIVQEQKRPRCGLSFEFHLPLVFHVILRANLLLHLSEPSARHQQIVHGTP